MGIEQNYKISKVSKLKLNNGRTYDFQKDVNFVNDIKQTSNLSDHLIKIAYDINPENSINYNSRLDKDDYNLKEDSIRYQYSDLKNTFTLDKNLTNKEAFKSSLSDHFLEMKYSRKLTNNSTLSYNNEIDLENSFQFYKQSYQIDFFDDCSILSLVYTKNDYTDGTQLMPNSEISVFYSLKFDSGFTDSKYANNIFE
jgi:hypothetical protein